jgi:RNA polymerase-binding transcription factor
MTRSPGGGSGPAGRTAGPRATETRAGETRTAETRAGETPAGETPAGETRAAEPRATETRAGETRTAETRAAEPRTAETRAGETRAGETQATEIRAALAAGRAAALERIAALDRDFAGIVAAAAGANTDDEHDPEGATIAFERAQLAALAAQAREHLAELDGALARLDRGRYGLCEACGTPIAPARLAARPAARTCITCAGRR